MNRPPYKPKPKPKAASATKAWLEAELTRQTKMDARLGRAGDLLAERLPPELTCAVAFIRGNVLTLRTDCSASVYRISTILRSGLAAEITKATDGRVQRVKVTML